MANYYTNRFLLSDDATWTTADAKQELTQIEKIGLEHVLQDFITEYEVENYGVAYTNIINYTRWMVDGVDILDGYTDSYIFDNYAISCIYCTNNGIILLNCFDLETYTGDDPEGFFNTDINDRCLNYDFYTVCNHVTFRLN